MHNKSSEHKLSKSNICISIGNIDVKYISDILNDCSLAEIRMDLLELGNSDISMLFNSEKTLIATYREGNESVAARYSNLKYALESGANYIDLDIKEDISMQIDLIQIAKKFNSNVILSYHNFDETPTLERLSEIVTESKERGGDIIKIACKVTKSEDLINLIGLYHNEENIISFGIGKFGIVSRIMAPVFGAPFTYTHHKLTKPIAEGQIEFEELLSIYKSMGYC